MNVAEACPCRECRGAADAPLDAAALAARGFGPCPMWADLGQLFRRAGHLWDWEANARVWGQAPPGAPGPWVVTVWPSPAAGDTRFVAAVCRTTTDLDSLLRRAGH